MIELLLRRPSIATLTIQPGFKHGLVVPPNAWDKSFYCAPLVAANDFSWSTGVRIGQPSLAEPPNRLSRIWEVAQQAGQRAQSAWHPVTSQKQSSSERMRLALDGCLMNIRTEGWKEAKLGVVFEVQDSKPDPSTDAVNYVECGQQSCVIHLGGPEGLSNKLVAEANARRFHKASQQAVLGDGADWIWKIADTDYPRAAQINDWYHACQHRQLRSLPKHLANWQTGSITKNTCSTAAGLIWSQTQYGS
jgi:hypothetical protein